MNTEDLINPIVEEVGFSGEDKKEVVLDLVNMVNTKLMIDLSSDDSYQAEFAELKELEEKKDLVAIGSKMEMLSQRPDFINRYKNAFTEVIKDWLVSIAPSLSEDKKSEIVKKLKQTQEKN